MEFEIIYEDRPINSINDAKEYYDISQTVPTLIVKTDKGYYALIMCGDRGRVDFEQIKSVLQCEKVKLAGKSEVLKETGFEVGNVPPVAHGLPSIMDSRLLKQPFVFGGAGEVNYTLKMDPKDLEKVNNTVARID